MVVVHQFSLLLGWPALQIQLLQELVVAARRMGDSALATRHMTFLLQTMWSHLSVIDQKEFAIQLQVRKSKPVYFYLFSPFCSRFQRNVRAHQYHWF